MGHYVIADTLREQQKLAPQLFPLISVSPVSGISLLTG